MQGHSVPKQELEAVLKLSPEKRYTYTIKRICDWEVVWTLCDQKDQNYLTLNEDKNGKLYIYLFPFEEFASYYVQKEKDMQDTFYKSISLDKFIEETFDKLKSKNIKDALVFPAPLGYGLNVSLDNLKKDIEQELEEN